MRETLAALKQHPVEVIAVAVLVDRSGGQVAFDGVPLFSLVNKLEVTSWAADECPLCASNIVLVKPGTTAVPGA